MIEIKGLKKSFGKHEVLKGIDLTIQDKEVVVIIGPSGSGKSTILRCINYLEQPTAGEIIVVGISMSDAKSINNIRKEVGMVFQRFNLLLKQSRIEDNPVTYHIYFVSLENSGWNRSKHVFFAFEYQSMPGIRSPLKTSNNIILRRKYIYNFTF